MKSIWSNYFSTKPSFHEAESSSSSSNIKTNDEESESHEIQLKYGINDNVNQNQYDTDNLNNDHVKSEHTYDYVENDEYEHNTHPQFVFTIQSSTGTCTGTGTGTGINTNKNNSTSTSNHLHRSMTKGCNHGNLHIDEPFDSSSDPFQAHSDNEDKTLDSTSTLQGVNKSEEPSTHHYLLSNYNPNPNPNNKQFHSSNIENISSELTLKATTPQTYRHTSFTPSVECPWIDETFNIPYWFEEERRLKHLHSPKSDDQQQQQQQQIKGNDLPTEIISNDKIHTPIIEIECDSFPSTSTNEESIHSTIISNMNHQTVVEHLPKQNEDQDADPCNNNDNQKLKTQIGIQNIDQEYDKCNTVNNFDEINLNTTVIAKSSTELITKLIPDENASVEAHLEEKINKSSFNTLNTNCHQTLNDSSQLIDQMPTSIRSGWRGRLLGFNLFSSSTSSNNYMINHDESSRKQEFMPILNENDEETEQDFWYSYDDGKNDNHTISHHESLQHHVYKSEVQTTPTTLSSSPIPRISIPIQSKPDDKFDEEDPFGFNAERDQLALIESFRLFSTEIMMRGNKEDETDDLTRNLANGICTSQPDTTNNLLDICDVETHPNQSLFDILDRSFHSVASYTVNTNISTFDITPDDVKICFVALVITCSPPEESPYAAEFNHDLDEKIRLKQGSQIFRKKEGLTPGRKWLFFRKNDVSEGEPKFESDEESNDSDKQPRSNTQTIEETSRSDFPFVPYDVVSALWVEVLKNRGLDVNDIDYDNTIQSSIDFIRDCLLDLDLISVQQNIINPNLSNSQHTITNIALDPRINSKSIVSKYTMKELAGISVHHSINRQYGNFIGKSRSSTFRDFIDDNIHRWFIVVSGAQDNSFHSGDFSILILPHILIKSGSFDQAKVLLTDASFIEKRLNTMDILSATTLHVTDIDNLLTSIHRNRGGTDLIASSSNFISDAYGRIKEYIEKQVDMNGNEAGKALHLMAMSLGSHGLDELEIHYFDFALKLKGEVGYETVTLSDTLHCLGFAHDNAGRHNDALDCYNKALVIRQRLLGKNDLRYAETCHNKGAMLCEMKRLDESIILLKDALKVRTSLLGEQHEHVADTLLWIGNVMRESRNSTEALDYFKKSLQIKKAKIGDHHIEIANILHNMAIVLEDSERYDLSLHSYKEAYRIRELIFGSDANMVLADTLLCLGHVSNALGRYEDAEIYFSKSIDMREEIMNPYPFLLECSFIFDTVVCTTEELTLQYHRLIECYEEKLQLINYLDLRSNHNETVTMTKLSNLYACINDWDSAIDLLQDYSFKNHPQSVGNCDEEYLQLLLYVGKLYILREDYSKSLSYFDSILKSTEVLNASGSEILPSSFYLMGIAFEKTNQYDQAVISLKECLRIRRKHDDDTIKVGYTLYWLGKTHFGLRDYEKAISTLIKALQFFNENKKISCYQVITKTLHLLGRVHFENNHRDLARQCFMEEIQVYEMFISSQNSKTFYYLGKIAVEENKYVESVHFFRRSLQLSSEYGESNVDKAETMFLLGDVLMKLDRFVDAEKMLKKTYEIQRDLYGTRNVQTNTTSFSLARVYDELKNFEKSFVLYKECLKYREQEDPHSEKVAETLFFMGKTALLSANVEDGIRFFEQALKLRKEAHGDNNYYVAITLHELGKSYALNKMNDKSVICCREALRIMDDLGGDNEMEIALICLDLAKAHDHNNSLESAEKNYTKCIDIMKTLEHELLPSVQLSLGLTCHKMKKYIDSISYLSSSVNAYKMKGDMNNDFFIGSRHICECYVALNQYEKACSAYEELITAMESCNWSDEEISDAYFSLGKVCIEDNDLDKAYSSYQKCIALKRDAGNIDGIGVAKTLLALSIIHERKQNYKNAVDNISEALRIFKLKKDPETASSLKFLARNYRLMNKSDEALECYEECLNFQRQLYGDKHVVIASTLYENAELLSQINDEKASFDKYMSSFKMREMILGLEHIETITSLEAVSAIYFNQNNYAAALENRKVILDIQKKLLGETNQKVAETIRWIGIIYVKTEDFQEAIKHLLESIGIQEDSLAILYLGRAYLGISDLVMARENITKASDMLILEYGEKSLEYGEALSSMGNLLLCEMNLSESLVCCEKAISIFASHTEARYYDIMQVEECRGRVHFLSEKYQESIESFSKCLSYYVKTDGDDSETSARVYLLIGKAYVKLYKYDTALLYYKKCIKARKQLNAESIRMAEILVEVGELFLIQNKGNVSIPFFVESLRIVKLASDEGLLAFYLRKLGRAYLNVEKYDESLSSYEQARNIYVSTKEETYADLGLVIHEIGCVHDSKAAVEDALICYEDSLKILREVLRDDDLSIATILYNYGVCLSKVKRFHEASEHLMDALKIRRQKLEWHNIDVANTLFNLAKVLEALRKYTDVLPIVNEALDSFRFFKDKAKIIPCLHLSGSALLKLENFDAALSHFVEAWQYYTEMKQTSSREASLVLFHLGYIHREKKNYTKALGFLRQSLKIRISALGLNHFEVASTCDLLGSVLQETEQYDEALKLYKLSRNFYQENSGEYQEQLVKTHLSLGAVYSLQKNYNDALYNYEICLNIKKVLNGNKSEEVAEMHSLIAELHDQRVDNEEAMKNFSQALTIRKELYGIDDVKVADTLVKIAHLLEDWGDNEEAIECLQDALRIFKLKLGHNCPRAADMLMKIGSIYADKSELEDALENYHEALSIYRRKCGDDSYQVGRTLQAIGTIYESKKDFDESFRCYTDALSVFKKSLGYEDLDIAQVMNSLGIIQARRKKFNEAIDLCTEALRIRRSKLSAQHLDVADTLYNLGTILDDCGNKEQQALRFYSEALVIYKHQCGNDDLDAANCINNIAMIHMKMEKNDKAIPEFSEALQLFRLKQGKDSLDVAGILFNLGRIYGKSGDYNKSLGCFRECLRIRQEKLGDDDETVVTTKKYFQTIQRKIKK